MVKAITDIRSLARSHTRMCIRTLAAIARNTDAQPNARIAAADILLDRGWGRAVQHVEQSGEIRQLLEVKLSVVAPDLKTIEHGPLTNLLTNDEKPNDINDEHVSLDHGGTQEPEKSK